MEIGDVVQLKSGGPKMTVILTEELIGGRVRCQCAWFEGSKEGKGTYPTESLVKVDPDDGPRYA